MPLGQKVFSTGLKAIASLCRSLVVRTWFLQIAPYRSPHFHTALPLLHLPLLPRLKVGQQTSILSADQAVVSNGCTALFQQPLADPGRLRCLEQLFRQIRVLLPQNHFRVIPRLRDLWPEFILVQVVRQLDGLRQVWMTGCLQKRLVLDPVRFIPGAPFLGQAVGKLVDLIESICIVERVIDGIPQGGNQTFHTAEGALVQGCRAYPFQHIGDRLLGGRKGQDNRGLLI